MNYARINSCDIANGTGIRVSLFVSGCRNRCKGCFNEEAWDFDYGHPFTEETLETVFKYLDKDHVSGLSILGGEPLDPKNALTVAIICMRTKERFPDKDIWLYTGYKYEDVAYFAPVLDYIDVLVDGPYIQELRDVTLRFRGSSNQRIIRLKEGG